MAKILVATQKPFAKAAVDGIEKIAKEAGYEFALLEKYESADDLKKAVADAEALIVRSDKVTADVIDAAKKLKIVVRAGAGYDNLDLEACTKRGIVAMNTPGQNSNAVAELVIGMMIYMSRGKFNGKSGGELSGKTLGLQGYGHIAKILARLGHAFGMNILVSTRRQLPAEEKKPYGIEQVSAEEMYSKADFISLHLPAKENTIKSINYDLCSKLPKGAMIVNSARKEIIDEDGLLRLLAERDDVRYVSDIAPEKIDEFNKFADRVYFTPKKMGAQTGEANVNAGLAAVRQIVAFFKNNDRTFQVNK